MLLFSGTLTICLFFINYGAVTPAEMIFDQMELLNASFVEGYYNYTAYRIAKYNRTTYVFNSVIEFLVDVDENFEMKVIFYYNRLNNNQYNKSPLRGQREMICDFMKKYHRLLITEKNKDNTNFPLPGSTFCPLKKGTYWLKNYVFDSNGLPPIFQEGHWKADVIVYMYTKNLQVWGIRVYFKVLPSKINFGR